jgi:hypothetical protein
VLLNRIEKLGVKYTFVAQLPVISQLGTSSKENIQVDPSSNKDYPNYKAIMNHEKTKRLLSSFSDK